VKRFCDCAKVQGLDRARSAPRGRAAAICLPLVAIVCLSSGPEAQDWPQWRGERSSGVGTAADPPARWSPTDGVVWRAELEGRGISSPVIAGGRAYVTTALTSFERPMLRRWTDYALGVLAAVGIPLLLRHRWRRASAGASNGSLLHLTRTVDLVILFTVAAAVVGFAVSMAVGPDTVKRAMHVLRDAGVTLGRALGREGTNFWFLDWDESNRQNIWMVSTAVALLSAALIPFVGAPNRLLPRLIGASVTLGGTALAAANVPWPEAYADRYPMGPLIVFYLPVAGLGLWHAFYGVVAWHERAVHDRLTTGPGWRLAAVPAVLCAGIFVSANGLYQREMVTRRVVCVDAATGVRVWQTDVFSTPPATHAAVNSDATPTPVVAGDTIVAAFGPGIAALSLDGDVLWSRVFPDWIEHSIYGAGSSPAVVGETVIVTSDREYAADAPSRVIAYSLKNGDEIWNRAQPEAHDGYATPVVYDDGYRRLLLALTSRALIGYDLNTGVVAWRIETPVSQPVPSPVVDGSRIFITGGVGSVGQTAAYRLRPGAPPELLWVRSERADVASPVVHGGRLFTVSSTGVMVSFDAATGRVLWRRRLKAGLGAFYASLVLVNDRIYAVRSNGTTYVVAAEDAFRLIAESSLEEEIFASPAVGHGCLLLRTVAALYCIGLESRLAPVRATS
jgi:outer membrane protein assembly factor BamB